MLLFVANVSYADTCANLSSQISTLQTQMQTDATAYNAKLFWYHNDFELDQNNGEQAGYDAIDAPFKAQIAAIAANDPLGASEPTYFAYETKSITTAEKAATQAYITQVQTRDMNALVSSYEASETDNQNQLDLLKGELESCLAQPTTTVVPTSTASIPISLPLPIPIIKQVTNTVVAKKIPLATLGAMTKPIVEPIPIVAPDVTHVTPLPIGVQTVPWYKKVIIFLRKLF